MKRAKLFLLAASSMYYTDPDDFPGSLIGAFLMNLFSDMEFFVGATPGYVAGEAYVTRESSQPLRWFFTISGALAFRF